MSRTFNIFMMHQQSAQICPVNFCICHKAYVFLPILIACSAAKVFGTLIEGAKKAHLGIKTSRFYILCSDGLRTCSLLCTQSAGHWIAETAGFSAPSGVPQILIRRSQHQLQSV